MKDKIKYILDNLEYAISAACLGLMTMLCFVQVITRYCIGYSITWAEELSVMLFIVSIFIGAIGGTRRNQHMRLEMVVDLFKPKTKAIIEIVADIVFIIVACVLIYAICINIQNLFLYKMKTPILKLPKWIPYTVLPISLFMIKVRLIEGIVKTIKDIKTGKFDEPDNKDGKEN